MQVDSRVAIDTSIFDMEPTWRIPDWLCAHGRLAIGFNAMVKEGSTIKEVDNQNV
jgi:hypothetical protein